MTVIGSKSSFAVRVQVTHIEDDWIFGKFCFLVHGRTVGNFDYEIALGTVFNLLSQLSWNAGHRKRPDLFHLEKNELFQKLDELLYNGNTWDLSKAEANQVEYGGLQVLCGGTEAIDNWKGYLIERETNARLIVSDPAGKLEEYALAA